MARERERERENMCQLMPTESTQHLRAKHNQIERKTQIKEGLKTYLQAWEGRAPAQLEH